MYVKVDRCRDIHTYIHTHTYMYVKVDRWVGEWMGLLFHAQTHTHFGRRERIFDVCVGAWVSVCVCEEEGARAGERKTVLKMVCDNWRGRRGRGELGIYLYVHKDERERERSKEEERESQCTQ